MSVVTVTLNPAIDETVRLDRLERGAVHRATAVRHDAGGKGVNVASCLADWGVAVTATGLLGQDNPAAFEALMARKRIADRFVRVPGATRTNIKLVDPGETTDVNLPGFPADPSALDGLVAMLDQAVAGAALVVLAGSLPAGTPDDFYAHLLARLDACGVRVLLDTSGAPLARALAGAAMPFAIKPNIAELAGHVGRPLDGHMAIIGAARDLLARGIGLVTVSMGSEGALFVTAEKALHAALPAVGGGSSVGAGDAMVAGIAAAIGEGGDLDRIARLGTAFAVGKLGLDGPNLPPRDTIEKLAAQAGVGEAK